MELCAAFRGESIKGNDKSPFSPLSQHLHVKFFCSRSSKSQTNLVAQKHYHVLVHL